ncbi:glycosyltransferase family 2 protein [Cupriavidus alkaliphilus]|uniref:Dolichol-phosphate mannosyltransferase n=1 Tax=Cupriavidus alkaliphilus TaxID=942866 RepID=A0A7W4YPW7_9BURK|nr:glycosyltransferase family 2 protein [Cupriavidus alkaliphilus]MBB3007185.1 dolichol-phosphate mannosyltransferase [Cupriavidus alkaliphilus]PVY77083.1 dolichol-phosphate mannosyltransferase [Cupriavidus alkaliphilus]
MNASEPTELSVIIPAHNEAASLPLALPRIVSELAQVVSRFEIVIVNDGSTDQTAAVADELARRHRCVRAIHFSRNFGKEAALEAGLAYARGRGLLFIDADLQHPPALIPQMVSAWRAGADVVNARKRHRGEEHVAYAAASRLFYRMFERATGFAFEGASDYKLLDRQVADALLRCPERDRFFRGLVAWVGFRQVDIPFDVAPREAGHSSWSAAGLLRYSLRSLVAFSSLPLQAVAMAGFAGVVLSFLLILQTVARYLAGNALDGFTTVIIAQAAFSSLLLLAVGVLAIYLARVYDAQKQRPSFFVRDSDEGLRSGIALQDMEIHPAPPRVRTPAAACDADHSRVDRELL